MVGHWPGEEQGLIGSHAYAYDHPEIVRAIQAGFNQDNGTGRIQSTSGVGLPDAGAHMQAWLAKLPQEFQQQIRYNGVGAPATGGTDNASFDCYGAPVFGLSSLNWDYGTYTHHTNRDSFDKIVFDDLKGNATIVAMLAYLASEDPTFITRERADLTAGAADVAAGRRRRTRRAERTRGAERRAGWAVAAGRGRRRRRQRARRQGLGNDLPEGAALLQRHVARHRAVEPPVGSRERWSRSGRRRLSGSRART